MTPSRYFRRAMMLSAISAVIATTALAQFPNGIPGRGLSPQAVSDQNDVLAASDLPRYLRAGHLRGYPRSP